MRVGIDGRELRGSRTGVGRYLVEILARWTRDPEASPHTLVVFTPEAIETTPWLGAGGATAAVHVVRGGGGTAWEQVALRRAARRQALDVFFAPGYTAPLWLGVPTVVTVHDVSFAAHPEWFRWREGLRRRLVTRATSHQARVVVALTDFGRREAEAHLGVPPGRIWVISQGADGHPCFDPSPPPLSEAPGEREPLVLYAGSIFNRRNVPFLVRGFARLVARHPDARLEIVGENRTHPHEDLGTLIDDAGVGARVTLRRYVLDEELAGLYRRARAFAFLSSYEGFALTPLEALRAGVPPVLLDTPVAREVYGDAALFVREHDEDELAVALERLLHDEPLRQRLLESGGRLLERYSWDRTARETLAALLDAARHPSSRSS
jgi:glycosyltransferase involved in cell wall biosynthesis